MELYINSIAKGTIIKTIVLYNTKYNYQSFAHIFNAEIMILFVGFLFAIHTNAIKIPFKLIQFHVLLCNSFVSSFNSIHSFFAQ